MLSALKVGQEIEYQIQVGKYRGKHWQQYRGRVSHITDRLIAVQTPKYPDCLALADLVAGHAVITSPALDFSRVRMENRQEPELVGKAEPYSTWKERREREGAKEVTNKKYDWDTAGPKVVAMLGEGIGIPEIARELDYPYHAVRDYIGRKVKSKPVDSPHPASVPELPGDTFNGLGDDIAATEIRDSPHPASVPELPSEVKTLTYIDGDYQRRIFERFHAQRKKGIGKYGQPLEDNPASRDERLEHLAQELTDGLMYIEWIKALPGEYGFREYAIAALRTAQQERGDRELLLNGVFGLVGEAGEVVDHLKKHLFQGHVLDSAHIADELGDVLWYVNLIAAACGCELDAIAQGNIAKLQARYPGAGFDAERSINRAEVTE